jgi:hypothetical protein
MGRKLVQYGRSWRFRGGDGGELGYTPKPALRIPLHHTEHPKVASIAASEFTVAGSGTAFTPSPLTTPPLISVAAAES